MMIIGRSSNHSRSGYNLAIPRMYSVSGPFNHSVEPIMVVSGVMNSTSSTIGLHQRVRSLHNIPIPHFMLGLMVASMGILHTVVELVLGVSLKTVPSAPL